MRAAPIRREGLAPARWISAVAGAPDAGATVQAVEALRGVLWEALLGELSDPTAREVGDIADRLAYVCAAALAVAVAGPGAGAAGVGGRSPSARRRLHPATRARRTFSASARRRQPAIVVDELARSPIAEHPSCGASPRMRAASIEIRDVRGAEGPAAWIGSIGSQLERFERDSLPFAVLLVELVELERRSRGRARRRLVGSRSSGWSGRSLTALGVAGSVTRERPGRYWLVIADTDRAGAVSSLSALRGLRRGATDRAPCGWRLGSPCAPRTAARPPHWPLMRTWPVRGKLRCTRRTRPADRADEPA